MQRLIRASAVIVVSTAVLAHATSTAVHAVVTAQSEVSPEPGFSSGDYRYFTDASGAAVVLSYSGTDPELILPGSIDRHPVKGIGDGAFYASA